MDEKCKSVTSFEHLKPLSVYSRMITSDKEDSHLTSSSNSFINFKIEIINSCVKKRKLHDSIYNDLYNTPAKKFCSPKSLSPDLGCFMDYYSPSDRHDTLSPFAASTPAQKSGISEMLSSQLQCKHVECGSSAGAEGSKGPVPHSLMCRKVLLNLAPIFDFDVEEILCLKEELTGAPCLDVNGGQEEKGCFSMSYKAGPKMGQTSPQSGHSLLPTATSSPLQRLCGVEAQQKLEGHTVEPINKSQNTHSSEETTLDMGYETTLPLQVQVKSVVVVPSQHTTSNKLVTPPSSKQNAKCTKPNPAENGVSQSVKCVSRARSHSPVVFNGELDWEHGKCQYVHLVTRHMNENQGGDQDIMAELLNLMSHVADQTSGSECRQWQHPSDLTSRNYQRRFGNSPAQITLHEWHAKKCKSYQRFARLPKHFKRSFISLN
ncbi:S100P-binding protein [Channa argus]|uniref:S100P-binding protein n=1 Tax=Channa argus TaxID=215402 RepID=A0A6G1QGR1_CHAAH|nr:S100P-binding protein [Channa argus]